MDRETWERVMASDEQLEERVREGMAEHKENLGRENGEPSERTEHPAKKRTKLPGTSPREYSYWRGADRGMFGGSY